MSALTATQAETLASSHGAPMIPNRRSRPVGNRTRLRRYSGWWTIRQIVHHIADDGDAWSMNFKAARNTGRADPL